MGTCVLHHLTVVVQSETLGPTGLVESTSATTWSLRGTGTRSARRNLVGAGTKNARRSPAEAGTTEATAITKKVATEAEVIIKKGAVNLKVDAKGPTGPLADLPPHHLVEEVEAGDLTPAQSLPPAMARAMHGNISTSTDLNTLAQSASAG